MSRSTANALGNDRPTEVEPNVSAPFFVQGRVVEGNDATHRSRALGVRFATPALDLNGLVLPRTEVPPLLDVPLTEIIDFLVETGERVRDPKNDYVRACVDRIAQTHILPRSVLESQLAHATAYLDRQLLCRVVEQNFPDPRALDGWIPKRDFTGRTSYVRAFAPRLVHVLPGNSPGVAIKSIAQGALVKAVNLFKMSSSDPFSTVAILRTMADIDAHHPIVRSMSAVYWRGGDAHTESALYRPHAASDVMILNQEACASSRFIYAEGAQADVDRFCARLQVHIAEKARCTGDRRPLAPDLREQIEALMFMDDDFRVWGKPDGNGVVIRSNEPVDFHPIGKTANVVRVDELGDAMRWVTVATQTVGFYPPNRMADYRDRLASAGAQRVTPLGEAGPSTIGNPHDAMYPLHRFVHWMAHEDGCPRR